MDYKISSLPNSLRVMTIPMPALESATVTVWVKTGSRNEEDKILGISHFLEHMAFKGGKKYKSAKAVSVAIDEIGGEFNAGTSKEWTKFYVHAQSAKIERAYDVLSDMLLTPLLKTTDIEREKGVIIEEMNMYEDTPYRRIWDLFEQEIFKGHTLGRDIIGTKSTIPALKRADFASYRDKFYYASNMLITCAGSVTEKDSVKLAEKYFGKLKSDSTGQEVLKSLQPEKRSKLHSKKVEQAHFVVGFPADKMGSNNRYKDAVANTVLSGGMSSRLFTEVREKRGLAYSVRSDFDRYLETGYFAVYAGTDPKKATEALKVILDQLYGLAHKTYKVDKNELVKAKEYIKGHLALSLEDTGDVSDFFGMEYLMTGKTKTPEEVNTQVDKVSVDDVYETAKRVFDPGKLTFTVIGPYKDDNQFKKVLR